MRVVYQIAAGSESPRDARRIVAGELGRFVSAPALDDLKLLISDLVTGRVDPSRDAPADALVLDCHAQDLIRCSVLDTSPARLPDRLSTRILDHLADRWGVTRRGHTTQVWFEVGLAPVPG